MDNSDTGWSGRSLLADPFVACIALVAQTTVAYQEEVEITVAFSCTV